MADPEGSEGAPQGFYQGGKGPKVLTRAELSAMMKKTMGELLDAKLKSVLASSQQQGSSAQVPGKTKRKRSPPRDLSPVSSTGSADSQMECPKKPKGFEA